MFKNKSILITGGTGSFGKEFIQYLLNKHKKLKRIIVYSRDELKQYEMEKNINEQRVNIKKYLNENHSAEIYKKKLKKILLEILNV